MKTTDLYWLAGLLEGEGFFTLRRKGDLLVGVRMTDLDVIQRVRDLLKFDASIHVEERDSCKDIYLIQIHGRRAVGWMMTLYSLMGERRKSRIRECLAGWHLRKAYRRSPIQRGLSVARLT